MSLDEFQEEWDAAMLSQEFKEVKHHQWFHRSDPRREDPEYDCERCHDEVEYQENGEWKMCQDCCPHDETDHYICLDCGADTLNDAIGRAEMMEDR